MVRTVSRWTGRESRALREAGRWSVRDFAAVLGVAARVVSRWEAGWESLVPANESQRMLDTLLSRADAEVADRFWNLNEQLPRRRPKTSITTEVLTPTPEPGLIQRSDDHTALAALLTDATGADTTVALCGPGGFGKTTLATQVCADPTVRAAFSEILWVETGQNCTPARVLALISDLCVHLEGQSPPLTTAEQAGFHLARIVAEREVLIVIDNVWSAADLAPFLLARCTRLVTTRNIRTCPATARPLRLGPMSGAEVSELLTRAVTALPRTTADRLADLCGGWPLLATVVGSNVNADLATGVDPEHAVAQAHQALAAHGAPAFDVWDADQRSHAIGHAITASLHSLDTDVTIPGGSHLRDRYLSLAVFPAATPVPIRVLTHWWRYAHGWTIIAVRQFCRALADRSLISAYLPDRDVIVLHDVFRSYLTHLVADRWTGLHRSLLDSYRALGPDWTALPEHHSYLWQHLTYHLHAADLGDELVEVLARPAYITTKAATVGPLSLVTDTALLNESAPAPRRNPAWTTAHTLTSAGFLLNGLRRDPDRAATLHTALVRAQQHGPPSEPGQLSFATLWAHGVDESLGHIGAVVSVANAGPITVSGGEDGAVRIWHARSRAPRAVLRGHTGWVYAVALTLDAELAASAGDDAQIRLWSPRTGEAVGLLAGHRRRIRALAFTPDARWLISAAEDGNLNVWDLARRALRHPIPTTGVPLWTVAANADNTTIAAAGQDEYVRLYDLATGELLDEKAAHRDWIRTLAFAPNAPLLASGSGDNTTIVWDTHDATLTPLRVESRSARVRSVQLTDATVLYTATEDAAITTTFGHDVTARSTPPAGVDWIRSLAAPADDGSVIAGCEDGSLRQWNPADPGPPRVLASGANTVWSTHLTAAGHALLGYGDGSIEIRDLTTATLNHTITAPAGRIWSLAANRTHLAAACADGSVRLWPLDTPDQDPARFNDDAPRTWAVALSAAGTYLAASLHDGSVRCWHLPTATLAWHHHVEAGRIRTLAFDPTERRLTACGGNGTVHLWDTTDGRHRAGFANPGGWARSVAIDASGERIAVGSGSGDIHIRDLTTDRYQTQLPGHAGRVLMLAFADTADTLLSAAADGTVKAWSLYESDHVAEVRLDASLHCAAAEPRTGHILAAGPAGPVMLRSGAHSIIGTPATPHRSDTGR
ncbi:NB-ARC domain-containing protein [Nocardia takedensis]|uniref:NB-ARC domain-containing protein n=1 Tax=Nocardia takedensis TaxID=259390 RepID=UPI001C3F2CDD|nr:NB-ARC domain-containing protein [Nocardia takedensis]